MVHKVTNLRREASMISLQQGIQSYLTTLTTEGKSPTYTEWLGRGLRYFHTYLEKERDKTIMLKDLSMDDARNFIKWLMDKRIKYAHYINRIPLPEGLSPTTIHGYARAIRSLGTFLMEEGYTAEENSQLLSYLEARHITPGTRVVVTEILSFNQTITVEVENQPMTLGNAAVCYIFVETQLSK